MTSPSYVTGVAFLGSGSHGNAALVHTDGRGVLVDCGLSAREARRRIDEAGLGSVRIEALLITHEHSDHISGVRVLACGLGIPVYATRATAARLSEKLADVPDVCHVHPGEALALGGFSAVAFRTSHDAADPVGYVFEDALGRRIGIATDTGTLTREIAEAIVGCDLLGIEANHDPGMLDGGPYPRFLKDRIFSEYGHLSNCDAGDALEQLVSDRLRVVIGLHLSEHNNLPRLARVALLTSLGRLDVKARVEVASQHTPVVCTL